MIIDPFLNNPKTLYFKKFMTDSFLHNHQSALDSQREEAAIKWSNPDPGIEEDEENFPAENDEPSDFETLASFGTVWHDWL